MGIIKLIKKKTGSNEQSNIYLEIWKALITVFKKKTLIIVLIPLLIRRKEAQSTIFAVEVYLIDKVFNGFIFY